MRQAEARADYRTSLGIYHTEYGVRKYQKYQKYISLGVFNVSRIFALPLWGKCLLFFFFQLYWILPFFLSFFLYSPLCLNAKLALPFQGLIHPLGLHRCGSWHTFLHEHVGSTNTTILGEYLTVVMKKKKKRKETRARCSGKKK